MSLAYRLADEQQTEVNGRVPEVAEDEMSVLSRAHRGNCGDRPAILIF
jgi:hypothetical protein